MSPALISVPDNSKPRVAVRSKLSSDEVQRSISPQAEIIKSGWAHSRASSAGCSSSALTPPASVLCVVSLPAPINYIGMAGHGHDIGMTRHDPQRLDVVALVAVDRCLGMQYVPSSPRISARGVQLLGEARIRTT